MKVIKKITTLNQARKYLYAYIPQTDDYKFPGSVGLKRTKYLLKQLGEPQNKLRIIHIAGTSGKGSTAFYISGMLEALGFNVGLSVSPHLLDIRERFQVNNRLINEDIFCKYLNEIRDAINKVHQGKFGRPTYFEINIALAYYIFYKLKLDYAVLETGLGGLYDATNVVTRSDKVAVITKIGHDHTQILGKTLDKIAFNKVGIIQPSNIVVTTNQNRNVMTVIEKAVVAKHAKLYVIDKKNLYRVSMFPQLRFDFNFEGLVIKDIRLKAIGSFQIQNCSLALGVIYLLSKRDNFIIDKKRIKNFLIGSVFKGRMQRLEVNGQEIIIDGAHNPQKMSMFIHNLIKYYPNQKFDFLIAFKKGKDYKDMLRYITPVANKIVITSFLNQAKSQGFVINAENTQLIARVLSSINFKRYEIADDNVKALAIFLSNEQTVKVITGSLFLLSDVYPRLKEINAKETL